MKPWGICDHAHTGWLLESGQRVGTICEHCAALVVAALPDRSFEPSADVEALQPAPATEPEPEVAVDPAPQLAAFRPLDVDDGPYLLGMTAWVQRQLEAGQRAPARRVA